MCFFHFFFAFLQILTPPPPPPLIYRTLCHALYLLYCDAARRALAIVYAEDTEEYDLAMLHVCAKVLGIPEEDIQSVSTDFGPEGALSDPTRNALTTSRWAFL